MKKGSKFQTTFWVLKILWVVNGYHLIWSHVWRWRWRRATTTPKVSSKIAMWMISENHGNCEISKISLASLLGGLISDMPKPRFWGFSFITPIGQGKNIFLHGCDFLSRSCAMVEFFKSMFFDFDHYVYYYFICLSSRNGRNDGNIASPIV